jgi:nudix-type nucleoside diphosphatase (YffH/AdpP family)
MSLSSRVRVIESQLVFKAWAKITTTRLSFQRSDGQWQEQVREVYDHGDGAAVLLYNLERRSVILIRQFRYTCFSSGYEELMLEVPAGMVDAIDPDERIRLEAEEETGFRVSDVQKIAAPFSSPGSVTERIHLYVAPFEDDDRVHDGGGKHDEGEDIEVLDVPFDDAYAMIASGGIVDAKTIILLQYAALHIFPFKD